MSDETVTLSSLIAEGFDLVLVLQQVLAGRVASNWYGGGIYDLEVNPIVRRFIPQS